MTGTLLPGQMNLTLVAHYGAKPPAAAVLIARAQDLLVAELKDAFRRYEIEQVHATIIGLEGTRIPNSAHVVSTNYLRLKQQVRIIDFHRVLALLSDLSTLRFEVRLAGYEDGALYPFTSRGQHPYLRSFSFQDEIAVAMGWPIEGDRYPFSLDRLRRELNEGNILHKYHASAGDIDNDFFFVLGRVDRAKVNDVVLQSTQERMRRFLASEPPVTIAVNHEDLTLVAYTDASLPRASSAAFTLREAGEQLDQIIALYRLTA